MKKIKKFFECTEKVLRRRLRTWHCQCSWCGRKPGKDFHHIVPTSQGGIDDWSNKAWVCELCHAKLDDFCRKCCHDPKYNQQMDIIKSLSISSVFWYLSGTTNKKDSSEVWDMGGCGTMRKTGKEPIVKKTGDDLWQECLEVRKYCKLDERTCIDYLIQFTKHTKTPIYRGHINIVGGTMKPVLDDSVLIVAPSFEKLEETLARHKEERPLRSNTKEEMTEAARADKAIEDAFFHKKFNKLNGSTMSSD